MTIFILRQRDQSHGLKAHAENPEENFPELDFAGDIVLLDETSVTADEHYGNLQNNAKNQQRQDKNHAHKLSQRRGTIKSS